jgi:PilZ domain
MVAMFTLLQHPDVTPSTGDMMASTVPSPQDSDAYADRRAAPRVSVALPAFLQADGERHSIQLLDLSSGGAKLHLATVLQVGTTITLDCGTFVRPAVVRWQDGDFAGVSFDGELNAREIAALLNRSKALTSRMKTRG